MSSVHKRGGGSEVLTPYVGPKTVGKSGGHKYCCDPNQMVGSMIAILAAITLIFACILGAGVFGGGKMSIIAGGLTVGSMVMFGFAAYSLLVAPSKNQSEESSIKTTGDPDFLKYPQ